MVYTRTRIYWIWNVYWFYSFWEFCQFFSSESQRFISLLRVDSFRGFIPFDHFVYTWIFSIYEYILYIHREQYIPYILQSRIYSMFTHPTCILKTRLPILGMDFDPFAFPGSAPPILLTYTILLKSLFVHNDIYTIYYNKLNIQCRKS